MSWAGKLPRGLLLPSVDQIVCGWLCGQDAIGRSADKRAKVGNKYKTYKMKGDYS